MKKIIETLENIYQTKRDTNSLERKTAKNEMDFEKYFESKGKEELYADILIDLMHILNKL